ncbi:Oxidoreductase NAD-binding domain-containing protein 1 [Desmophyllum pertusum]|uniref:Oxidoreductase NAD-binding domain-containing protein 1 n=1 Tax=Desmophyllum pertusum TaxID=174260 RepID=A0A9W9ZS38_9CNID|nr:Oxidoreductase NAD-binding domain-containing protein 1 [Desmophyllum pertusum]
MERLAFICVFDMKLLSCVRHTAPLVCYWSYSQFFLKTGAPCSRLLLSPLDSRFRGFLYSHRSMSAKSNGAASNSTHLERTDNSSRQESVTSATVTEISQLSETVKKLHLKVEDNRFIFKPGQWVDFFIPGVHTVGGFSICSSPRELKEKSTIELAVKHSDHRPALWVHTKCIVGSKVHLRVGGDFYFDPSPGDCSPDLLLVAGGVGINPLYSIVRHVADISTDSQHQYTGKTMLLFSAKNQDELLYKDSLMEISKTCPSIRCKFFVTKPENGNCKTGADEIQNTYEHGRISESRLQEVVSSLDRSQLICYICGPPPMIQRMSDILYKLNIAKDRIHFERWW